MSSPLKFCDKLGSGWAGLGRLFDWVLGNLFEYWDKIRWQDAFTDWHHLNRQHSATYKLSFFLPSSSDETAAQRRVWKARVSSFCELKLGVEESDEKRGTSEVLRERPCSLRWLAATWGTSRISTKYGEKTEYYWITYRKVPITNVYLKVDWAEGQPYILATVILVYLKIWSLQFQNQTSAQSCPWKNDLMSKNQEVWERP